MRTIKRFSIFIGIFLFVFFVCVAVLITSVFKSQPSTSRQVAIEQADTDGFEVVVIENDADKILDAHSMKLVEAKQAVQQKNSTTFVIPFGSQHEIEKMLVKEEHFEGDLIKVSVEKAEYNEQIITLGFHYGAKTYRYCYRVSKGNIIPLWSSFSSLGKDSHTTYISNSK